MEKFKKDLDNVINKTFDILREKSSGSRLVFPTYSNGNGKRRVSEQELRFVFVEQLQELLEKYDLFYSVETPTHDKYKFTENRENVVPEIDEKGQSANFDLTIVDKDRKTIAIIEFKAKMASEHEYAKDLCKLWNPNEKSSYKYFLNLFEKIEKGTQKSFEEKLCPNKNRWLPEKNSSEKIIVMAQSLEKNGCKIKEEI